MPWDSTSGWRSSFSFTAHKMKSRYQWFPQETAANEDHWVPWLLRCLNKFESQSLIPCTYSLNERSVQASEKIAKCQINVFKQVQIHFYRNINLILYKKYIYRFILCNIFLSKCSFHINVTFMIKIWHPVLIEMYSSVCDVKHMAWANERKGCWSYGW